MPHHEQTWARVNAPVDRGIKSLVEALSAFPQLETRESCQGDDDHAAWISFVYGAYWLNPWCDLAEFVLGFLGPGLARKIGDRAYLGIHVSEVGLPYADLCVRPGALDTTTRALRELYEEFRAAGHTSGSSDGTVGTSQ